MYRYVGIWVQSDIWFVFSYPSIGISSVYSCPVSELELFQPDTELVVSQTVGTVQKVEIVLSNFYLGLFQTVTSFMSKYLYIPFITNP